MKINIKVRVLDKGKRFQLSYNQGSLKRTTASKIYNIVEKRLLKLKKIPLSVPSLASRVKGKIKVYVDYRQDGGFNNSGEYFSSSEALYVFCCFLEDYLTQDFQNAKYKKYFPMFTGEKYYV